MTSLKTPAIIAITVVTVFALIGVAYAYSSIFSDEIGKEDVKEKFYTITGGNLEYIELTDIQYNTVYDATGLKSATYAAYTGAASGFTIAGDGATATMTISQDFTVTATNPSTDKVMLKYTGLDATMPTGVASSVTVKVGGNTVTGTATEFTMSNNTLTVSVTVTLTFTAANTYGASATSIVLPATTFGLVAESP